MSARLVIAGTHSGVGKTTITVGLIDALRRRGLTVQPYKVGPDYIDPSYHTLAAGRACRTLDTWMLPPEYVCSSFARSSATADVAVIEGVMGLYDGGEYDQDTGSTAEVAKLLEAPVVLVVDAAKMARSAGAIALGYQRFDEDLRLVGFIANRVASEKHGQGVAAAIEHATGLPVLGFLSRELSLQIPERHLGLIPTGEPGRWQEFIRAAGDLITGRIDLDKLLQLAGRDSGPIQREPADADRSLAVPEVVIAVARDEAFHFLYEDNLDLLRAAGATIAYFSPLVDQSLPPGTSGVLLSGGFPEAYAERLSSNRAMHMALQNAHRQGLPIYAECGGLMYLTTSLRSMEGHEYPMVGLLPGFCIMGNRVTLGYRLARAVGDSWFLRRGEEIRGHEFHYSIWKGRPDHLPQAYSLVPRSGHEKVQAEGAQLGNLWASYVHVHFGAKPRLAERFVESCRHSSVRRTA